MIKKLDKKILATRLENRIIKDLEEERVGAVSVCVRQEGETIYENHFGESSFGVGNTPNKKTMYRLASMTKPITAVAALILNERGLLSLDQSISKYFPNIVNVPVAVFNEKKQIVDKVKLEKPVTIAQLLSHANGIGVSQEIKSMTEKDMASLENAVEFHFSYPLAFEPMTKQEYSATAAFDIVARIIEIVSGKSYDKFLIDEIFSPLGMKNTTYQPTIEQLNRLVYMHDFINGKKTEDISMRKYLFENYPFTYFCGGAGLVGTLEDYSIFAEMLLNKGVYNGVRILSEKSVKLMATPYVPEEIMNEEWRWSLGVRVITKESYNKLPVGAFGWSGAYGTHFWVDPINNVTAIYLKNSLYDGGSSGVTAAHFEKDVNSSFIL